MRDAWNSSCIMASLNYAKEDILMKPEDKKKFIVGKDAGKLTKKLFEARKSISKIIDESMAQLLAVGLTEDEAKKVLLAIVDRAFEEEI